MKDSIRNLIYGSLIGDAMGCQFEFFEKKNIPKIGTLKYNDSQVLPITAGNWSDDGDNMILLLQTILESSGDRISHDIFAKKLHDWYHNGIKEIGKNTGIGCGNTMYLVINHPKFPDNSHEASDEIYKETGSHSNGSLMKISILGLSSKHKQIVIENTLNICKVTNSSPLVQASCLAVTLLVYYINNKTFNPYDLKEANNICEKIFIDIIQNINMSKEDLIEFGKGINVNNIEDLILDEEFKIGYCLKTMGCAFWAIRNISLGYEKILKTIYQEGGDTDTNGIVAGGIVSLILGHRSIPESWINGLKHKDYIEKLINMYE